MAVNEFGFLLRCQKDLLTIVILMAPRVGLEPTTNSLHFVRMFPKGVDYIIVPTTNSCRTLRYLVSTAPP